MREILFRGKRIDNKEWVEGFYFESFTEIPYIMTLHDHILGMTEFYEVDPATVGQFTGLLDKNGKRIFEGDVIEHWYNSGTVRFGEHQTDTLDFYGSDAYGFYVDGKDNQTALDEPEKTEIIGTIHDD